MSFQACEDAQRASAVIGGVNPSRAVERAPCLQGQERRAKDGRELGQERAVDAEPEVSFDSFGFEGGGLAAEEEGAQVSGSRFVSACGFLAQKKEGAAQSPEDFVIERGGRCAQQSFARAHALLILTRSVERVRAFYRLCQR